MKEKFLGPLTTGTYNETPPVLRDGEVCSLQLDINGNLKTVDGGDVSANWKKLSFTYTQLQAAALSNQIAAFDIPSGNVLSGLVIKHFTAFAGTSISAVIAQLGTLSDPSRFVDNFNIFGAVSDTAFENVETQFIGSFASVTTVYLKAIATGANLSALNAGGLNVYYQLSQLPN